MNELDDVLKQLSLARQEEALAKESISKLRKQFEETADFQSAKARLDTARETMSNFDNQAREIALNKFMEEPSNKRPHPKIGIRERKQPTYDIERGRNWCMKNMPVMLILDTHQFDKYLLKAEKVPSFVKIDISYEVTLATNLEG